MKKLLDITVDDPDDMTDVDRKDIEHRTPRLAFIMGQHYFKAKMAHEIAGTPYRKVKQ